MESRAFPCIDGDEANGSAHFTITVIIFFFIIIVIIFLLLLFFILLYIMYQFNFKTTGEKKQTFIALKF